MIPPYRLHALWSYFVVDLVDIDLAEPGVPTLRTKVFHPVQSELPEISRVLAAARHKWEWNIPLYSVYPRPWWDEGQYPSHDID